MSSSTKQGTNVPMQTLATKTNGEIYQLKMSSTLGSGKWSRPRVRVAIIRAAPDHYIREIRDTSKQTVISATGSLPCGITTRSIGVRAIDAYHAAAKALNFGKISEATIMKRGGVQFS